MWQGRIAALFLGPKKGEALLEVPELALVGGQGIQGDRKFGRIKGFREVTLLEAEAVEAATRDYGLHFGPEQVRRNLLTRGVALNHLVGKSFQVGAVTLEGMELCEPCLHMEELAGVKGIRAALIHRGGLCARILSGGVIGFTPSPVSRGY